MRIRSIRPEFWRSGAISALDLEDRLLFIGLWSYVDDNGVGLDKLSNIAADLFADDIENDPRDTFARVSRGLSHLSAAGRIVRYTIDDRPYLYIVNWDEHQKIDRPGKPRYPLPDPALTTANTDNPDTLATDSRDIREDSSTGEGEKGRRGEGEKSSSSDVSDDPTPPERPEVEAMLDYLDSRIAAEGIREPPTRTKKNRDAARRMLDRDGYDPHEIRAVIDWTTRHQFWATNIGCAAKLREKYQTLRAQMNRPQTTTRQQQTDDLFNAAMQRAANGVPNPFDLTQKGITA